MHYGGTACLVELDYLCSRDLRTTHQGHINVHLLDHLHKVVELLIRCWLLYSHGKQKYLGIIEFMWCHLHIVDLLRIIFRRRLFRCIIFLLSAVMVRIRWITMVLPPLMVTALTFSTTGGRAVAS